MNEGHQRPRAIRCLVVIGTVAGMGGAERQALYLIEELVARQNMDVQVLTFHDGNALRPELKRLGIPIHVVEYHHLWPRPRRTLAMARMLRVIRNRIRPHAILPFVGIHSKTMGLAWPYTGAKYCWWNQQDEGRDLMGTATEKRILEKASHVISNSWAGRDFLVSTYSLPGNAVTVYNNGTPLPPSIEPRGEWRTRPQYHDRQIVAMVANITPYKDHETLLRAWRMVLNRYNDDRKPVLLLAGSLSDTAHALRTKGIAFDMGLSADHVSFLGPVEDVNALLSDAHLVVHSSIAEGCPNAVCEAMAMGRAVVATDIPGCRQALGDSGGDCYSPPGDSETMSRQILSFLSDDALRTRVGLQNRSRIERDFSIEGMNEFFLKRIATGLEKAGFPDAIAPSLTMSLPA